jgi:hypothetical protein
MIITNIITPEMFFLKTMYLLLFFLYIKIVAASTGKVSTSEYWEHWLTGATG